jgi:glycosyltransferase involved in cell wall biosynthesis
MTSLPPSKGGLQQKYSVCMLCSNDAQTVKASVESVLELSKYRKVEVIVVDNLSTDGSEQILRDFRDAGSIALIERKCSRGEGRQLAMEASSGGYVLGHMDCDDVFDAIGLDALIDAYHARYEGMLMMTQKRGSEEASNITVAPRSLLKELGGWRDLNWGEDWDLWARAGGVGKYAFAPYPVGKPPHRSIKVRPGVYRGVRSSFGMRSRKYADAIRTGRRMFKPGEPVSIPQKLIYYLARGSVALRRSYLAPVPDPDFSEFPTT